MVNSPSVTPFVFSTEDFERIFPFFVLVDSAGKIVSAGRSLKKLSRRVLAGAMFQEVFSPKRPAEPFAFNAVSNAVGRLYTIRERESGAVLRGEFHLLGADLIFVGSPWVSDAVELLKLGLSMNDFAAHDPTLELQQLVQIQRMVSADLKKVTAKLTAQAGQLEEAARTKDAFLASMSHELRTPLTSIIGLSEVLREQLSGPLNETQLAQIGGVHSSGMQLLALLNDILDLARLGSGEQQLAFEICSVSELCSVVLLRVELATTKRNQRVSCENLPGPAAIRSDQRRVVQLLDQLLSNASKFTAIDGELGLRVSVVGQEVVFTVWDRGIGIAASELPHLFRPFVQIDGRLARRYSGTGLGLAIAEKIVGLLGGASRWQAPRGWARRFPFICRRLQRWHRSVAFDAPGRFGRGCSAVIISCTAFVALG